MQPSMSTWILFISDSSKVITTRFYSGCSWKCITLISTFSSLVRLICAIRSWHDCNRHLGHTLLCCRLVLNLICCMITTGTHWWNLNVQSALGMITTHTVVKHLWTLFKTLPVWSPLWSLFMNSIILLALTSRINMCNPLLAWLQHTVFTHSYCELFSN